MKFSIVTPSYNQAQFIERTIQSVLQQEGDFELEYFIIDGGSDDGSIDIIRRYAEKDSRIQWVSESDNGQSDALNKGLRKIDGDIVAYINSDDVYLPGAFQKVATAFTKQQVDWVTGYCDIIDEHDKERNSLVTRYKNYWLRHFSKNVLMVLNPISQPATFWSKHAFEQVGMFNEDQHLVMDYEYWCRLMAQGISLSVIQEPLAAFRVYSDNKSTNFTAQQFAEELAVAKEHTNSRLLIVLHDMHRRLVQLAYRAIR